MNIRPWTLKKGHDMTDTKDPYWHIREFDASTGPVLVLSGGVPSKVDTDKAIRLIEEARRRLG
ncbi:MAG: hypothetical protein LZF60_380160 [Nitrospira sp.]|nr:MAG: hypothetical protein LZF60_380160 [Nitrospira sp.]